jgi:glycosyltransferase involved in cell wall biosynthesis
MALRLGVPDEYADRYPPEIMGAKSDRFLSMGYSAADLFASCPVQEPFSLTVLEAMVCGIPVISHAVGGIPDVVRNGAKGLTVPATDVGTLADAITGLPTHDVPWVKA